MTPIKIFLVLGLVMSSLIDHIKAQPSFDTNNTLDTKQQRIVAISAFAAKGDLLQLPKALNEGLDARLTIN
ncbi:MAG: carboxymuconolactone decarboxylase, partial [Segetibacter sp.]|nr:carboxymuconolactone decarboxylase [Segetibacter sp.]